MPIKRDLCKLMTEDLIQRFDHIEAQFERVRESLPQLWTRKELQDLVARLESLRGKMERPRYYVGFLGRSQVGKSSTLNSVLRAASGEEPCTGGRGAPATSTVTRIYRKHAGTGNPEERHLCLLRYMNTVEFASRREILCKLLGFDPNGSNESIVAKLDDLIRRDQQELEEGDRRGKDEKIEDYKFFRRLLLSHKDSAASVVRKEAVIEQGAFGSRGEYTNHPEGKDSSPYLLLRQVEIPYQTESISEKIELIDLPGLGARLASDDELTKAFLPNLDGALIFQSSEQVAAKEAYDLLARLSQQYPRMKGRVWMVITRFDSVARNSFGYGSNTTIFDHIYKTMTDNQVPLSQVLLVGNEFHRKLKGSDGVLRTPTAENFRDALNLDIGPDGSPQIPEGFRKHPELLRAFEEVLKDGGIGRVSQVIGETLAEEVEREVRDEVATELKVLGRALTRQVQAAKDASSMDTQSFRRAVQWKIQLQQIVQEIDRARDLIEGPGLELMARLRDEFKELFPDKLTIDKRRLRKSHLDYVRVLSDQALAFARDNVLPRVYDSVGVRLRAAEQAVGKIRLDDHDSPVGAWEERQDHDLHDTLWILAEIQAFDRPELFPEEADIHLRDNEYRAVMIRKIDAVAQRATFTLGRRIKGHLDDLVESLALINGAGDGRMNLASPRVFDDILGALA